MKLKISTCRVRSEKKTRSCSKSHQLSFCHKWFLCPHCHFTAGVGSGQQWEQPFIFCGLLYFRKKFCTSELNRHSPSAAFTLGISCLAIGRLEVRNQNALWLVSLRGAAQCSSLDATAPQNHSSALKQLPITALSKTRWRLNRLGSLFNFHSDISHSNLKN